MRVQKSLQQDDQQFMNVVMGQAIPQLCVFFYSIGYIVPSSFWTIGLKTYTHTFIPTHLTSRTNVRQLGLLNGIGILSGWEIWEYSRKHGVAQQQVDFVWLKIPVIVLR